MARFYDLGAWRRKRRTILARDGYRCVNCGRYVGGKGQFRVDHKVTIRDAPHLRLVDSNLRTLCATCDNQIRLHTLPAGNDVAGYPRDGNHPWNR